MKVYLLTEHFYDEVAIIGVFDSHELAELEQDKINSSILETHAHHGFCIREYEVQS